MGDQLWVFYLSIIMVTFTCWKLLKRGLDGEESQALIQGQLGLNGEESQTF